MSYHQLSYIGDILQVDLVGKTRKGTGLKFFLNYESNCVTTTKVKGTFACRGEYTAYNVVYKVTRN